MKLYLSSHGIGHAEEDFVGLFTGKPMTIAYIPNALDYLDDFDRRAEAIRNGIQELQNLGFSVYELDLRNFFDDRQNLSRTLENYSGIFVRGGNSFILRRAFALSGLDAILADLLEKDALIYAGYSAAITMLAPSLHGADLVDDPFIVPAGYTPELPWDCLGILPYAVAPHYKSNHVESSSVDSYINYMLHNHMPFIVLKDGEVLVVDNENHKIVGLI